MSNHHVPDRLAGDQAPRLVNYLAPTGRTAAAAFQHGNLEAAEVSVVLIGRLDAQVAEQVVLHPGLDPFDEVPFIDVAVDDVPQSGPGALRRRPRHDAVRLGLRKHGTGRWRR